MKKFAIVLFNDTTIVVEADSQREALKKEHLDGDNKWMVTSITIAMREPAPCLESKIDEYCGLDNNVLFVDPANMLESLDSYLVMGLA